MTNLNSTVTEWWRDRITRWINKRVPLSLEHRLYRKNLYTFPTVTGFAFGGILLLLWLLGTNYQNNLILALCYMLISLSIIAILVTYGNLAGLKIRIVGDKPGFAGEAIGFILEVDTRNAKGGHNVEMRWEGGETSIYNFDAGKTEKVVVYKVSDARGYFRPGRLLVQSTFPLGLIRCWSWLNLDARAIVFPKPIKVDMPQGQDETSEGEGVLQTHDGDDFSGLREYYPGAPIKHVAWKHYAREKGLFLKEYGQDYATDMWLDWNSFEYLNGEDRLSGLCYWALQFHGTNLEYGLKLPGITIEQGAGGEHHLSVMSALACFDLRTVSRGVSTR